MCQGNLVNFGQAASSSRTPRTLELLLGIVSFCLYLEDLSILLLDNISDTQGDQGSEMQETLLMMLDMHSDFVWGCCPPSIKPQEPRLLEHHLRHLFASYKHWILSSSAFLVMLPSCCFLLRSSRSFSSATISNSCRSHCDTASANSLCSSLLACNISMCTILTGP